MKRMYLRTIPVLCAALALVGCDKDPDPFVPSGKDNNCKVIINEIDASQDIVELFNPGPFEASLEGLKIRRMRVKDGADDEQTMWTGTSGVSLGVGSYLVLKYEGECEDNKTFPLRLQHPIPAKKNVSLWLQDRSGKKLCSFQRGVKDSGWGVVPMQKCEDSDGTAYSFSLVEGEWVYALPTPGAANGAKAGAIDATMFGVVINEIDFPNSTIELYNLSSSAVDIKGFQLRWSRMKDAEADNQTIWEATVPTVIKPGGFLSVSSRVNLAQYASRNVHIRFRDPLKSDFTGEKMIWDDFKRGVKGNGWTSATLSSPVGVIARIPDGTGLWYSAKAATPGKSNGTDTSSGLVPDVEQD